MAVNIRCSTVAIISVLRFLAKIQKKTPIFLDDYLIAAALTVTLRVTINNILGTTLAGLGSDELYRTDPQAPGFPFPQELLPQGIQILHACAIPLIKASILASYSRIFDSREWFQAAVWVVSIYIFNWWISLLLAKILHCDPISDNWGTQPNQLENCLPNISAMYETAALTNMFSDVLILALPLPITLHLYLVPKHKLAVHTTLLIGSIVVAAGIGRGVAYFSYRNLSNFNCSSDYYSLVIWTSLEPTLGIVGACLPCIRPAFKGWSADSVIRCVKSLMSLRSFRSSWVSDGIKGTGQENNGGGGDGGLKESAGVHGDARERTKSFKLEDVKLNNVSVAASATSRQSGAIKGGRGTTDNFARGNVNAPGEFKVVDLENGGIRLSRSYDVIVEDKI